MATNSITGSTNPTATISTNFGNITVELYPDKAPKSVSNFIQYAFDDFYDNVLFHRVVDNFVIQAGLFNAQGVGKTGALRAPIELESNNGLSNLEGTVGLARTDSFNSATSQFYINVGNNVALDYQSAQQPGYAVFGKITAGLNVAKAIAKVAVAPNSGFENVPVSPVVISDVNLSAGADQLIPLQAYVAPAGVGSARLQFNKDQIRFKPMSDGSWAVIESGGSSLAKLVGYQRVLLNDKAIGLDLTGNAGQAYRVYKAAFDRDPMQGDTAGLGYWIGQLDKGMSLIEVSARFIDSGEFRQLYGQNPSNEQFLTKVYTNVLDRSPDPSGYGWWLDQLTNNPEKTWQKVLADFAESNENKANVAGLIGQGITYDPWSG